MRDLFKESGPEYSFYVARIVQLHLSDLVDGNYLKPVMWAEDDPIKHFAVSVGMYYYLRPLYLYTKLCNLRNCNDDVALENVKAFQSMDRNSKQYDALGQSKYKKSEDETELEGEVKPSCTSCTIFFEDGESRKQTEVPETNFNYFGNCAEFDIVQTAHLKQKLRDIRGEKPWEHFKSGCEKHIRAFKKLKMEVLKKVTKSKRLQRLKRKHMLYYYNQTHNTNRKALKYKWSDRVAAYGLVTKD